MEVITNQDYALEQFRAKFDQLGKRVKGFETAIAHIFEDAEMPKPGDHYIIETGTARIRDNWFGDGQSTLIWDWCCKTKRNLHAISIDIDPKAIETAKSSTELVEYITSDSLKALREMPERILSKVDFLYLDSMDWRPDENLEVGLHHMFELSLVYAKLPPGCMIMVDDCHTQEMGKHAVIRVFFANLGIDPVFEAYQTAWIKPGR